MQNEIIDTGGQEAPDGVIGRFDDRFPLHIERGVQQHGNAGDRFEFREQRVQPLIVLPPNRLHARRAVDVNDRRDAVSPFRDRMTGTMVRARVRVMGYYSEPESRSS
jgi:hypothetical protein